MSSPSTGLGGEVCSKCHDTGYVWNGPRSSPANRAACTQSGCPEAEKIKFHLDGVPAELVTQVRGSAKLRESLLAMHATGIRLVPLEGGWSNPRDDKLKSDEAFEVQILGRPGKENDTSGGPWGKCYVKLDGQWGLTNISVC